MSEMLIDPRRLRSFVAVAEELNFTRAAERLGIAQQPLSQQIARLERDVGARLFERSTRRVSLTDAGRSLYGDAVELLARLDDARRRALLASRGEAGRITIGCGSYAVESLLPRLLRTFRDRYPGVTVSLYEGHTADQLEALRRGDIDIAFAISPAESEDLVAETISEDGFVVATALNRKIPKGRAVPLSEFRGATFVAAPRWLSPGLDDLKARLFADAGFEPKIGVHASQLSTMLTLVAAGVGCLLTPAAIAGIARTDLAYVPIKTHRRVPLSMVARRASRESAVLHNLCGLARSLARQNRIDET
jgi:DNA-binding transcriptional LysR family regulator